MSSIYGPPVPGSAQEPPPVPWQAPGGPGGSGNEPGAPPRRPHRRRRLAVTAACVVLVLAAALGTALALNTTPATPHKPVSRTSAVAAAVDPALVGAETDPPAGRDSAPTQAPRLPAGQP